MSATTPPPTPEHSDLKQQIISIIMEFHTLNRATGIITAWRPDLAASKIDALIATATAQARREGAINEHKLLAKVTRHAVEAHPAVALAAFATEVNEFQKKRLAALDGDGEVTG